MFKLLQLKLKNCWGIAQGVSHHGLCAFYIATFQTICNANQLKQHFRAQDTNWRNNVWNLCSKNCFLSRTAHARGAARGLGKRQYIVLFTRVGTFPCLFSSARFFWKNKDFERTRWPKWSPKVIFLWAVFRKSKSVFRLHRRARIACEPPPWSA